MDDLSFYYKYKTRRASGSCIYIREAVRRSVGSFTYYKDTDGIGIHGCTSIPKLKVE